MTGIPTGGVSALRLRSESERTRYERGETYIHRRARVAPSPKIDCWLREGVRRDWQGGMTGHSSSTLPSPGLLSSPSQDVEARLGSPTPPFSPKLPRARVISHPNFIQSSLELVWLDLTSTPLICVCIPFTPLPVLRPNLRLDYGYVARQQLAGTGMPDPDCWR